MIRRTEKYTRHLQRLKDRFSAFVSRPEIREKAERLRAEIADRKKERAENPPEVDPEQLERLRYQFQFNGELHRLDFLRLMHEETGNPLFAWTAFKETMEHHHPVPPWVNEYLLDTARNLTGIDEKVGRAAGVIQKATGIDGRHFVALHEAEKRFRIFEFIVDLRRGLKARELESDDEAFFEAAEKFGMGDKNVRRIFYEFNDMMEKYSQL